MPDPSGGFWDLLATILVIVGALGLGLGWAWWVMERYHGEDWEDHVG